MNHIYYHVEGLLAATIVFSTAMAKTEAYFMIGLIPILSTIYEELDYLFVKIFQLIAVNAFENTQLFDWAIETFIIQERLINDPVNTYYSEEFQKYLRELRANEQPIYRTYTILEFKQEKPKGYYYYSNRLQKLFSYNLIVTH